MKQRMAWWILAVLAIVFSGGASGYAEEESGGPASAAADNAAPVGPETGADAAASSDDGEEAFTLDLPPLDIDPEDLPPELRPLDIERPWLEGEVAEKVLGLQLRVKELRQRGFAARTNEEHDEIWSEAIALTEEELAIRERLQGNSENLVRWCNRHGEPAEWFEITNARITLRVLNRLHQMTEEDRAEFQALGRLQVSYQQKHAAGYYAEALELAEENVHRTRALWGRDQMQSLSALNNKCQLLHEQGHLEAAH